MRLPAVLLVLAACGSKPPPPTLPEKPPRDLGPEDVGPVPPEVRSVDTDGYAITVDGPARSAVNQRVQATVTIRAKEGLFVSPAKDWQIEAKAPQDTDIEQPVVQPPPLPVPANQVPSISYVVAVTPLRAGVKHITFRLAGTVCNEDLCDVVGDHVSWNLEVK